MSPNRLARFQAWPRWRRWSAYALFALAILGGASGGVLMAFMEDLPAVPDPEEQAVPSQATRLYDIHGSLITQLAVENRTIVHLDLHAQRQSDGQESGLVRVDTVGAYGVGRGDVRHFTEQGERFFFPLSQKCFRSQPDCPYPRTNPSAENPIK